MVVAEQITDRVNSLEGESVSWLKNFSKHLGLHPKSIEVSKTDPRLITVRLKSADEAETLRGYLASAIQSVGFLFPLYQPICLWPPSRGPTPPP